MKVIKRHQNEIKFCYEQELQKNPALAGKVAVAWTIDATGGVSEANISESSISNANVESCIEQRIRRWKFPEPQGGGVVNVTFPWIFKAAGDEGGE
jgi:TonB family protein